MVCHSGNIFISHLQDRSWNFGPTSNGKPVVVYHSFIYLFGVLRRFQHCTGHITTGSWKGRGNQYIEFARVVYCKLLTNGKQLPAFPLKALTGIEPWPQRWCLPFIGGTLLVSSTLSTSCQKITDSKVLSVMSNTREIKK